MGKLKGFLRKIKLIENFSIDIPLNTTELVKKLDAKIDEDAFDWLESFSSSKNEFKGVVNSHGFKVKKKFTIYNSSSREMRVLTVANGSFIEHNEITKINIEIIGYDTFMKIFYCFQIFIYSIVIVVSILLKSRGENLNPSGEYAIPVMILFGMLLIIGPYINMRKSIKSMKSDLERELFNLPKN